MLQKNKETEEGIGPGSTLEDIASEGIFLYIEEDLSSPGEIYRECFGEDSVYMPDYVMDDLGRLKELRFHKVSYI